MNAPENQSISEFKPQGSQPISEGGNGNAKACELRSDKSQLPVIIIGAPRSGTNLLRDLLTTLPGLVTWSCDEINAIWTYSNSSYGHDALPDSAATDRVKKYVRRRFSKLMKRSDASVIVEKTCANSLRVAFVDRIFPAARYVFIHRNGLDAAVSAELRWHAPIDLRYTLAKVKAVPLRELFRSSYQFALNRLPQFVGRKSSMKVWGPNYGGMEIDVNNLTTLEVSAKQWAECIQSSVRDLNEIPANRVLSLSYEEFVTNPENTLKKVSHFVGVVPGTDSKEFLKSVNSLSIGNSSVRLTNEEIRNANRFIEPANKLLASYIEKSVN